MGFLQCSLDDVQEIKEGREKSLSANELEPGKLAFLLSLPRQGPPVSCCMMTPLGLHLRSGFVALLDWRCNELRKGDRNPSFLLWGVLGHFFLLFFLGCFFLLFLFHFYYVRHIWVSAYGFSFFVGVTTSQSSSSLRSGSTHSIWAIDGFQSPLYLFWVIRDDPHFGVQRIHLFYGYRDWLQCSKPYRQKVVAFFSASPSVNAFVRRPSCTSSLKYECMSHDLWYRQ